MMANIMLALYVLSTSLGLIFIKLGTTDSLPVKFLDGKIHLNLNVHIVGGILLYGISFMLYTYLISKHDLGYIIPLTTALVYIVIFLASYLIFHEVFTLLKITGIGLIVIGLILLNIKA